MTTESREIGDPLKRRLANKRAEAVEALPQLLAEDKAASAAESAAQQVFAARQRILAAGLSRINKQRRDPTVLAAQIGCAFDEDRQQLRDLAIRASIARNAVLLQQRLIEELDQALRQLDELIPTGTKEAAAA